MPKNTKKRTQVKDLARSKQQLTPKAAKKVKGGLLSSTSLTETAQKVRIGGTGTKGSWDLGSFSDGLQ